MRRAGVFRGERERSNAVAIRGIRIRPGVEQTLRGIQIVGANGPVERSGAVRVVRSD